MANHKNANQQSASLFDQEGLDVASKKAERLGAVHEEALSESDAAGLFELELAISDGDAETASSLVLHMQWLLRELAEQSTDAHRQLAMLTVNDKGDGPEAEELQARIARTTTKRDELKAYLATATAKVESRGGSMSASHADTEREKKLLPVRHKDRDFFLADLFEYALKDDGVSMEAPIFTLATKPDTSSWKWVSKDGNKKVEVYPSVKGRATQHDKDVLIYCISQMTEGLNRKRADASNRTVRFTVHDYLVTTNKNTSKDDYRRLQNTFERLRGTSITTDIRTGGERVKEGFGIIDSWTIVQKSRTDDRMVAVEVTLSRWLYNAVQAYEVLTIHPDYFRLRKPLERRLYELARKHCGKQAAWTISLDLLREKSGSRASLKEFSRMVSESARDNILPEYRLSMSEASRLVDVKVTFYSRAMLLG